MSFPFPPLILEHRLLMIAFVCPHCGKHYQFSDRFAGRSMICVACRTPLVVPAPEEEFPLAPRPESVPPPSPSSFKIPVPPPPPFSDTRPVLPPLPPLPPAPPDASAHSVSDDDAILAHVFEEKRLDRQTSQDQEEPTASVPASRSTPTGEIHADGHSSRFSSLQFWGSLFLFLALILGSSVYLSVYVDWSGTDPRLELLDRLAISKSETIIEAKSKESDVERLRLRALDAWNKASEVLDVYTLSLNELEEATLHLSELDVVLRRAGTAPTAAAELTRKHAELGLSAKIVQDRLANLRRQFDAVVRSAAGDETGSVSSAEDAESLRQQSVFYETEAERLRNRIAEFPKERTPVSFPEFDSKRHRIQTDATFEFGKDWTENRFSDFEFAGLVPDRSAATFEGQRRFFGDKSLRIDLYEKVPAAIVFPKSRQAHSKGGQFRSVVFSVRFPEYRSPLLAVADARAGRIEEIRIRFGNALGYVEFKTVSTEYCDTVFYDARGKFLLLGFSLEGDAHWLREDHFVTDMPDDPDESIDSLLHGESVKTSEKTGPDVDSETSGETENRSFFSRIDWAELRIAPVSNRTIVWLDGIHVTEKKALEPFDSDRSKAQNESARQQEQDWFAHRSEEARRPIRDLVASLDLPASDAVSSGQAVSVGDSAHSVTGETNSGDGDRLEFAGAKAERARKLLRRVLQDGRGRIRALLDGRSVSFGSKSTIPDDLESLQLEEIDLPGSKNVDEELLDLIGERRELRRLNLSRAELTNKDILKLSSLESLEELNLAGNKLTFEAFDSLKTLKRLRNLNVDGIKTDAVGLDALGSLKELRVLNLAHSGIDGADLNYLLPLADLESLDISSTRIGDRGLATVRVFTSLEALNISKTRITNAGIRSLDALRNLKRLQLDGCSLDDDCLDAIGKIPNPESISALNTKITRDGIRRKLPPDWIGRFKLSQNSAP